MMPSTNPLIQLFTQSGAGSGAGWLNRSERVSSLSRRRWRRQAAGRCWQRRGTGGHRLASVWFSAIRVGAFFPPASSTNPTRSGDGDIGRKHGEEGDQQDKEVPQGVVDERANDLRGELARFAAA